MWGVAEAAFPTSLQVRHGYKGVLERDRRRFQIPPPVSPTHGWSHRGPLLMVREKGTTSSEKAITA